MKTLLILTTVIVFTIPVIGQDANPGYDSKLAKEMGADEYGMKWYVLVILKTGSNNIEEKSIRDSLFAGHLANIKRLAHEGKLIVAGPLFQNDNSYRGIFILNVTDFHAANELLQMDPAIKTKILGADLYKWYGSAALPEYFKTHKKIEKIQIK